MTRPPGPTAQVAEALVATVEQLSRSSRTTFQNPYEAFDWPEAVDPDDCWCASPELSSAYGTELWDQLDERQRRRLCFWEAANFYSLNIHGERMLMEGLARRLYTPELTPLAPFLHHFLDEENKHSIYFGEFCRRYARIYPDRKVAVGGDGAGAAAPGEADCLFFAKVLLFEEIVDRYNLIQGKDERLHPTARFINQNHHAEEARHLIFGRRLVPALWEAWRPHWDETTVEGIRDELRSFVLVTWREYYNPAVYADAGLDDPWDVMDALWADPAQQQHRARLTERAGRLLVDCQILDEVVTDG